MYGKEQVCIDGFPKVGMEVLVVLEPPTFGNQGFPYLGIPTAVMVVEEDILNRIKQSTNSPKNYLKNPKTHQSETS